MRSVVGRTLPCTGGGMMGVGRQLLLDHPALRTRAHAGARRRLDGLAQPRGAFEQRLPRVDLRLRHDVDRARLERFEHHVRAFFGQRGADDHRDRTLRHDLAQERHAVHARHLDVEDHDVGDLVLEAARGCERVGRGPHHLDVRIVIEDRLKDLAHRRRIVHDQHANFLPRHSGCAPARP
ncbi:hypothetical protein ACVINU_003270 [Bradyrhizobium diazoefficiens]